MKFSKVAVLAAVLVLAGCGRNIGGGSGEGNVGKTAPDFTLNDLNGKPFTFSSTDGKVRIVDFWATWCPPCREDMPHFKEIYNRYKDQGFEIVAVSIDKGPEEVREFVKQNDLPWITVMSDEATPAKWNMGSGIPSTFLVDRKGRIVEHWIGSKTTEMMDPAVKAAL